VSEDDASALLSAVAGWRPEAVPVFEALLPDLSDVGALLPSVVEYRGCVLNKRALDSPHLSEWFEDRFGDAQREYVLNHVHLWDVTWQHSEDAKADALTVRLREALPIIAEFWRWSIGQQTKLPVEVWTADDPEEYGPTIGYGMKR